MKSIRKTITITTVLSVGMILVLGQVVIDITASRWLENEFDAALESKARAMATLVKFDGSDVEIDFSDELMPEFENQAEPEFFELFLTTGELIERSRSYTGYPASRFSNQVPELLIEDISLPGGDSGRQVSVKFMIQIENSDEELEEFLEAKIPLEQRPWAILTVSRERQALDRSLRQLHTLLFGVAFAALVTIVVLIAFLIQVGLKPLTKIRKEISEITPLSMEKRVTEKNQPEELEPVARQFNQMMDSLEEAFSRERQFSSDVAHELRTPVSEMRSLAEIGVRWPDEKDLQSYFIDIHDSAVSLERLIQNLLRLCRSEESNFKTETVNTDLETLINKVCLTLKPEQEKKAVSIQISGAQPPDILTDPDCMELVLHNLISNAVFHSPENSRIQITIQVKDGACSIEIDNDMLTPLTEEDLNQLFHRFWRKDTARSSRMHTGIGLSLVKSYTRLMRIKVSASLAGGKFRIMLSGLKLSSA